jgi:DNA modification methylase
MEKDNCSVILGDALKYSESIDNSKFDLIVSSPPYNVGKEYEKKIPLEEYIEWQSENIAQFCRVVKETGSIVYQTGNFTEKGEIFPLDILIYPLFKKHGMRLRNRIIWHFEHGLHSKKKLSGRYETVLWFTKTDNYYFNLDAIRVPQKYPNKKHFKGPNKGKTSSNPLGKNPSDFWSIKEEFESGILEIGNIKHNHPEKTSHPCQFPLSLVERFILSLTKERDMVYDPFGGSGTTAIASLKNNRRCVTVEKEEKYIEIINNRISSLLSS